MIFLNIFGLLGFFRHFLAIFGNLYLVTLFKGKIDRSLKALDLIIGDEAPPAALVKDAREKDIFIVTSQWIVQCLIHGQRLPYGDFLL